MRTVVDTNVLMSALLFSSGRLIWLRHAWQRHAMTLLLCRETTSELMRVLAYPKFKLTREEQEDILADVLPYAEIFTLSKPSLKPRSNLPQCRDPQDQMFLELTHQSAADALVTGDKDLLSLSFQTPFSICTPDALRQRMGISA